jgi:hypothetical protein
MQLLCDTQNNKLLAIGIMTTCNSERNFLNFLHHEMALTNADIAVALRHRQTDNGPLPMLLWQYGLVNLEQLEKIFDWLDDHHEKILV